MNSFPPLPAERLFTHFLDEVDGTVCLPATATAADLEALLQPHALRFPLFLDPAKPLRDQMAASTFAPASCRFGPFCDNIPGMNWRLPSGQVVRIGERVVKTTTGYDWLRFVLHSGTRYGEPVDYVIRLRPDCGFTLTTRFHGPPDRLTACIPQLLGNGWMHWWDSVDLIHDTSGCCLRVVVHCMPHEAPLFTERLAAIAAGTAGVTLTSNEPRPDAPDGLPDLVLKTTPDRAITLAGELAPRVSRSLALCYNGVVHVHLQPGPDLPERTHALALGVAAELHEMGGDWHSHHLPAVPPSLTESSWISILEQALHGS